MTSLLLAAVLAQSDDLRVPPDWQGAKQEGSYVASPKDLAPGKLYTLVVPDLARKLGSLKALLESAKATLGDAGTFTPLHEPKHSGNDAGWEYDFVIGKLEKGDKGLVAQAVVLRKGEAEAMLLVLADGVETMEKYSDAFTAMVRGYGAPKAVEGKVDLAYTLPEGWTAQTLDGGVLLRGVNDDREYRMLILASRPLGESLQKAFLAAWTEHVKPSIDTTLMPLPLMCRMKSGMAVAVDIDSAAKNKAGVQHHGGLYVLARGNRCVPILAFYFGLGSTKELDQALNVMFESAVIPGSGEGKVPLFSAASVTGTWSESSAFYGSYVTRAGDYAGDASVATAAYFDLLADGTFKKTLMAVGRGARIKEVEEGTWAVDDAELRLAITKKETGKRYRIFGAGSDPKVGAFLVLSTYNDTDQKVDLSIPRRLFAGTWYKRKD
jgi:hypothetical protein